MLLCNWESALTRFTVVVRAMGVSWRLAVTMFSVHIEILLWYGMFRVAEMLLISVVLMLDEELEAWKSKSSPLLQQEREGDANLLRSLVLRTLSSIS